MLNFFIPETLMIFYKSKAYFSFYIVKNSCSPFRFYLQNFLTTVCIIFEHLKKKPGAVTLKCPSHPHSLVSERGDGTVRKYRMIPMFSKSFFTEVSNSYFIFLKEVNFEREAG